MKTLRLLLLISAAFSTLQADTVVFQQGLTNAFVTSYAGVDDAFINSTSPTFNYGQNGARIYTTFQRGLMRFNLSSFANQYSRISAVTLTFEISQTTGSITNGTVNAYAIAAANTGWVEGTVFNAAQTGSSCWNFARNATQSWAGSAGLSTPGTDYDNTVLGTVNYPGTGTYTMTFNRTPAQLKALVNSWLTSTNPGILLIEGNASRDGSSGFYDSEGLTKSRSPKLTITYTTGPAILVEQPAGTPLDSGSSTVDCGSAAPGSTTTTRTFTIRNDGIATLSSIAASITGGNSGDFAVSGLGATSLAPGASTTVNVTFTPGAAGLRSSTLSITSNDTAFSPYSIALTGVGYTPTIITRTLHGTGSVNVGQYSAQTLVNGNPAVAYYDSTNGALRYVRANDAGGQSWAAPVTVDSTFGVGDHCSMAVINGNPAITYLDHSLNDLKYVRATDANGSAWGTPVTLDSTNTVGLYTSLAVVNGNPAVAYYFQTSGFLKYVRATDVSGSTWATPLTIDNVAVTGWYGSLVVVNGNPAVSYYDFTNGDLKYRRASDVSGSAWGAAVTVASTGDSGRFASMRIINGSPAISFYDKTNGDLKFIRATDVSGSAWPATALTLDSAGDTGQYTSLFVIAGNPAVGYYDGTNKDLRYVRATDISGTSWGSPVTLDATGDVGQFASLVEVNGNAGISYYQFTSSTVGSLKWANYLTTSPVIKVEQPAGTPLIAGVSSIDLGSSGAGVPGSPLTFTLRNDGNAALSGITVSTTSGNSGDFTVGGPAATSLGVGASTTFTITFIPGASGLRTATLAINSNDVSNNPFNLALTGTGLTALESWRQLHFSTSSNSGNAADAADPDGDGIKNLAEFAFGLLPNNASSLSTPAAAIQSGNLVTSFTQSASVSGITYGAEWSNDLAMWTAMTDSGSGLTHTFAVPIGSNPRLFLRWKITRP